MSITSSTSTSPVIMPDELRYNIADSAWYVLEFKVLVEWDAHIIKRIKNKVKIDLFVNRHFEITCAIDKKLSTRPTLTNLFGNLMLISTDGHKVTFRRPRLDPPPAGASNDSSRDKNILGYDWAYQSFNWVYDMDKGLYHTIAVIVGSWSKFCYRGTELYTYYA